MNPENQNPISTLPSQADISPTAGTENPSVNPVPSLASPTSSDQGRLEPLTQAEKPKSKFISILVAVLILVALGAAGLWVYQNYLASPKPQEEAGTPVPTATTDPTVDWKTYTDINLGYSIKYPSSFNFVDKNSNITYITIFKPGGEVQGTEAFSHYKIFIEKSTASSVDSAINQEKNNAKNLFDINLQFTPVTTINIGDTQGKAYYHPGSGYQEHIFTSNNNNDVYHITVEFANREIQSQEQHEVDQILSTFKFLGQTGSLDITKWKTYQISEFAFKYPENWQLDTGGKEITSSVPEITLWALGSNDPMYNECMKLENTSTIGNLVVKTFSRVVLAEACSGGDTTLMEKWIVKANGEGYSPGVQYIYKSTQKSDAEKFFDQILSTFKFN